MDTHHPPAEHPFAEAPLVRFRLRHMLLGTAAVSVLLAALMSLEGQGRLVLMVTVGVLAGHVAATLIGLRLRRNAERRRLWQRETGVTDLDESASRRPTIGTPIAKLAPPTALGARTTRLGWLPVFVASGALVGGLAGACLLAETVGHRVTSAGLVVGAVSSGMLGAWLAFVMGGFVGISRQAWREAVHDSTNERK
jgi:hypothetical protein